MKLGYARISTTDQDASMQVEALISAGVDPNKIFTDELSGSRERVPGHEGPDGLRPRG
jgi:DNA invertase Pin-like site-specific DNA recombinase